MNPPACNCGACRKCCQRRYWMTWRKKHPEYQRPPQPVRPNFVHPTESRMDAVAEQVWARFADPGYYAPAAERFKGWGPTAGVMRVD